ncbi:hypothetical protein GCHA_0872 [Paraglaciecola chathamensis S18K6]|uniref:Uncharacterized protein n=1 Tax=Paraglaciecola chathamensis S18K6 TaxID=1127672 RepID=A0AAV3UV93_9ALTE|nr:hypothetical protein GCHA_0872 [Paraglaciecola chathamensis S18K6]
MMLPTSKKWPQILAGFPPSPYLLLHLHHGDFFTQVVCIQQKYQ